MRYFTKADLEVVGARIWVKYLSLIEEPYRVTFINPVYLAEVVFGLKVEYFKNSSKSMLGFINTDEGTMVVETGNNVLEFKRNTIYINDCLLDDKQVGRCNFTVAHELAHYVIDLLRANRPGVYDDYDQKREERHTDYLAAAILMPKPFIESLIKKMNINKIMLLSKVYQAQDYKHFCDMARILHVSKQALEIRLKSLGFIEESYYGTEKDTLVIYPSKEEINNAGC